MIILKPILLFAVLLYLEVQYASITLCTTGSFLLTKYDTQINSLGKKSSTITTYLY